MEPPTFADILTARRFLASHLPPTPLWSYPTLASGAAAELYLKHENAQPTGAFKVRGGLTLLNDMTAEERARGVLGYSTGNHAQSLAYAARQFNTRCTIVMPERPNPAKARAVKELGAELIEHGAEFEEARRYGEKVAADRGMRLVSAANEPRLVAGVATLYLEIFEQAPDLDVLIVPVGSGSGAAAACLVAAAVAPSCKVIAVQSSASPAGHDSWHAGTCVQRPNHTISEGLATGSGFELPQRIMREHLADFVLVDDSALITAQRALLVDAHTLTETAGAAAYAAVLAYPDLVRNQKVAAVCTGANATDTSLVACLTPTSPE